MLSAKNFILLTLFTLVFIACGRKLTYEEYINYIKDPDNGLIQERVINGIQMKVTYRPPELLVYQELHDRDSISEEDIKETRERYGQQHYFVLSISQGGQEILINAANRQRFSLIVNQLTFQMDRNISLITADKDTLQLLDFHYPRMYATTPSSDIMFAFKKNNQKTKYVELQLDEFGLNTGDTRFRFALKDINKTFQMILIDTL